MTHVIFSEVQLRPNSFHYFLFKEKRNRITFFAAIVLPIIQFTIFKILYPFPDFFSDSYSYLYAASANLDINIWPIGYSKFLHFFHNLTHSDTTLIAFQYFFFESSAVYFFFSILYFYSLSGISKLALFILLFLSPLNLYICNYVNSDPLFAAVSILWFTQIIWILHQPKWHHIISHALLLFFCFTIRNNAYVYLPVSIFVFILCHTSAKFKLAGILLPYLFIIPFILHTKSEAKKITGSGQFSLFTGWQLANNALYIYDQIQIDSANLPTEQTRLLNRLSIAFFTEVKKEPNYRPYLASYVGNFFIRQPNAPLKKYFSTKYKINDNYSQIVAWGKCSVDFSDFGSYIIKHNPGKFLKYFVLLNTSNYFLPPLEKLEVYNLGSNEVSPLAEDWFDYKSPDVRVASKNIQATILYFYPFLFLFINLLYLVNLVWFLFLKYSVDKTLTISRMEVCSFTFLAVNFIFTIVATINVLRYQFVPLIICTTSLLILSELLVAKLNKETKVKRPKPLIQKQLL